MEALRFEQQDGDYQVIVRSEDLTYAWGRFKGRIDRENDPKPESGVPYEERYCRYASSDACRLSLYKYNGMLSDNTEEYQHSWEEKWPVLFETSEYNIAIRFGKGVVGKGTMPKVLHVRKDIETAFFLDTDYTGEEIMGMSGNVSFFLTSPTRHPKRLNSQKVALATAAH